MNTSVLVIKHFFPTGNPLRGTFKTLSALLQVMQREREEKQTRFPWFCVLFIILSRLEPVSLIILNITKYLFAFGQLFDLE
jgi:uncharacterized membrane protein YadS